MSSYNLGDIVSTTDYVHVHSAWIALNGNMHFVTDCGHKTVAKMLGFSNVDACEDAGYIHLSCNYFLNDDIRITKEQRDTVLFWCAVHDKTIPSQWALVEEPREPVLTRAYMYKLNRAQRDMLYPNSGD